MMKCHDPHSGSKADVRVFANGYECFEYGLPPTIAPNYGPRTLACFIPVSDGDILTIKGDFTGTVLEGALDLIADGSYVGDRRIDASKTGTLKDVNRKIDISKALDMPPAPGYVKPPQYTTVVEGDLRVKRLDVQPPNTYDEGGGFGIGTLVLNISVREKAGETYVTNYDSTTCGSWREREGDKMNDAGVTPTHELEVVVTDDNVHHNRQSKHRRMFKDTRFGHHPWATLVFFYRSHMTIKENGCQRRADDSHAFESVIHSKGASATKEKFSEQRGLPPATTEAMKARRDEAPAANGHHAGKKTRLLGQSLFPKAPNAIEGTKGGGSGINSIFDNRPLQIPRASIPHSFTIPSTGRMESVPPARTSPWASISQPYSMARETARHQPVRRPATNFSMPRDSQAIALRQGNATRFKQARAPTPAAILQPALVKVKAEPVDESSLFLPAEDTTEQLDRAVRDTSSMSPTDGMVSKPSPAALTPLPDPAVLAAITQALAPSAPPAVPASQTAISTHLPAFTGSGTTLTPAQLRKHTLSPTRESPGAAKRARINERHAALRAQLEEKKRRNDAAKQALEQQRRLREEAAKKREEEEKKQEELDAEEIAELERMIATQDEEYEGLQEAAKAEKDAYDEMVLGSAGDEA